MAGEGAAGSILTLNAGSSSIKFSLWEVSGEAGLGEALRGAVEKIGIAPRLSARNPAGESLFDKDWGAGGSGLSHEDLLQALFSALTGRHRDDIAAIGHRIVHGGERDAAALVTPDLLAGLARLEPLAPLHQPHNLAGIRAAGRLCPGRPQVACFDTAFHQTMGADARRLALPRRYAEAGLRRYGFHGLSYEFIVRRLRAIDPDLAGGRVIVAHLGNGGSLCALRAGRSVDTTMGFTPLDGLVMGTRPGTLDAGAVTYLMRAEGMGAPEIEDLLYHRSGLLGVSGVSSDMRALLASADPHAQEAVNLFVFRAAREIGALCASLGGLDGLVFTAGIGEHAAEVRACIAERCGWLGLALDPVANRAGKSLVSAPDSRVRAYVIPTDEERTIAEHTLTLLRPAAHRGGAVGPG